MTPEERAAELFEGCRIVLENAMGEHLTRLLIQDTIAAIAAEREECAMHVFTHSLAEFAGDTIPEQITHRTNLANSIRYRDRKDGAE